MTMFAGMSCAGVDLTGCRALSQWLFDYRLHKVVTMMDLRNIPGFIASKPHVVSPGISSKLPLYSFLA